MEEAASGIVHYLSLAIELIAALVIGVSVLQFLSGYTLFLFQKNSRLTKSLLRVQFGSSLAIALELLLAAHHTGSGHCTYLGRNRKAGSHSNHKNGIKLFFGKRAKRDTGKSNRKTC